MSGRLVVQLPLDGSSGFDAQSVVHSDFQALLADYVAAVKTGAHDQECSIEPGKIEAVILRSSGSERRVLNRGSY